MKGFIYKFSLDSRIIVLEGVSSSTPNGNHRSTSRVTSVTLAEVTHGDTLFQIATLIVVDLSQKKSLELRYAYRYFMNHGWRADF